MLFSIQIVIFTNMIKFEYKVIAAMSGTSLDGLDIIHATYVYKNQWLFNIQCSETIPYSNKWKTKLSNLVNLSKVELQKTDHLYSEFLGKTIKAFMYKHKISAVDFVSSHGHTALHQPENGITYQIGNQQIFADVLRHKVICDFRVQDVVYGGQGAPLVPIGDRLLFCNYQYCLNLGGFANISFENNTKRIAYDICPVNIVLNYYVSNLGLDYDNNGEIAATGTVKKELLTTLNQLNFYKQPPPKSLGLEWVKQEIIPLINAYNFAVKDVLRTFVEHVVIQISNLLQKASDKVLVTGGGAYNTFLIKRLKQVSKSKIICPENEIIEFKEALIFGLLGVLKDRNEVNCLKSVTGAKVNHSSGKILTPNF